MKSVGIIRALSITLCLSSILSIVYIDYKIADRYIGSDGKTKALFGIIELLQFSFKYFVLVPAILSILLIIKIIKSKEHNAWDYVVVIVDLIVIGATLTDSWRIFI